MLAAVAAALTLAGGGSAPGAAYGQEAPALSGRFMLVDQDGRTVDQDSYRGKLRVMTFGYTFCPDICPTTLATIAGALDQLGPLADQVAPIFVSVDPGRDTPAHLKQYLASFHPRLVGLTGTAEEVAVAARNFHVRYAINPSTDGNTANYTVDHSAGIYIMDRDGRFLAKFGYQEGASGVAERIRGFLG
jgi:protein SCO1/2